MGQKAVPCGSSEHVVYEYDDLDPEDPIEVPPIRSITGYAKNDKGNSDCDVTFRWYRLKGKLAATEKAASGESTATRTGHWAKVTAQCEKESVEPHLCRFSWTETA